MLLSEAITVDTAWQQCYVADLDLAELSNTRCMRISSCTTVRVDVYVARGVQAPATAARGAHLHLRGRVLWRNAAKVHHDEALSARKYKSLLKLEIVLDFHTQKMNR